MNNLKPPNKPVYDILSPYFSFVKIKSDIRQQNTNCEKIANDIFGTGKTKPLDMKTFFTRYMMKMGTTRERAESEFKQEFKLFKDAFTMLVGSRRKTISKNLFINKLRRDGICPSVIIMPKKSGYQMQDEPRACGIQNKNNMINILVAVLILLSIFYLISKGKK